MVGIWDPAGAPLASVLIPAGAGASFDGQFRTVAIAPLVLSVGSGYIVGGENFIDSGDRLAANVSQVLDPRIQYVDATFSNMGSGFVRPTLFSIATTGFYGPSFSVSTVSVPEPGLISLMGVGLACLGAVYRRSRKTRIVRT
jgi:hypothetical protein